MQLTTTGKPLKLPSEICSMQLTVTGQPLVLGSNHVPAMMLFLTAPNFCLPGTLSDAFEANFARCMLLNPCALCSAALCKLVAVLKAIDGVTGKSYRPSWMLSNTPMSCTSNSSNGERSGHGQCMCLLPVWRMQTSLHCWTCCPYTLPRTSSARNHMAFSLPSLQGAPTGRLCSASGAVAPCLLHTIYSCLLLSACSEHAVWLTRYACQLIKSDCVCRPALHVYNWVHTALRGLVTQQQTLSSSLHGFIQAYKQKNLAEVSAVST